MLACFTRAKLLKISDFLLIAVCAAIELLKSESIRPSAVLPDE
jgi:hypothetical protein